ncbi:MAG: hypothetical protein ABI642_06190 [Polaromonas sp.]
MKAFQADTASLSSLFMQASKNDQPHEPVIAANRQKTERPALYACSFQLAGVDHRARPSPSGRFAETHTPTSHAKSAPRLNWKRFLQARPILLITIIFIANYVYGTCAKHIKSLN